MKLNLRILIGLFCLIPSVSNAGSAMMDVVDSTQKDTANCLNLYKPYPVVLLPGADTLITRAYLQQFADFLDSKIVDEIYRRVRDAVCSKLTGVELPCTIQLDTIKNCTWDSLLINKRGVWLKDIDSAKVVALRFYERSGAGTNYLEFKPRDMDTTSLLRWPKQNGDSVRNMIYSAISDRIVKFDFDNLSIDSGGNIFPFMRSLFSNVHTDTVSARYTAGDTLQTYVGAGGSDLHLRSYINAGGDYIYAETDAMLFRDGADIWLYESGNTDALILAVPTLDMAYQVTLPDSMPRTGTDIGANNPENWAITSDGTASGTNIASNWYPINGIVQSGIRTIPKSQKLDTVYFADTQSGAGPYPQSGHTAYAGYRFASGPQYAMTVCWADSFGYGDTLYVQSKTDSSFVLRIQWDATNSRTVEWVAHGYPIYRSW